MSDYAGLIAELDEGCNDGGDLPSLLGRARATIEALVKERDDLKREMHARELHHFEEEQRSAGLAAVVEKAQQAGQVTGYSHHKELVMKALDTAPTDALREHDAALIESLAEAIVVSPDHHVTDEFDQGFNAGADSVYAAMRDRARQVWEGEA